MTNSTTNRISLLSLFSLVYFIEYDVGASTSATRNETGNVEQQEDGGDGVSSEGEKTLSQEMNEVREI